MTHRGSMDISSMLNDDSGDSKKDRPSRPPPPVVPELHTGPPSLASSAVSQGTPTTGSSYGYPTPQGQPAYMERRSSSLQAYHPGYYATATPITPHTPASAAQYHQPGHFPHPHRSPSYAHHSSSPYARSENSQPPPTYVASPQSHQYSAATPFGPSLRDGQTHMPPPQESPSSYGSRHSSVLPQNPVTPIAAPGSSFSDIHRHHLSESPMDKGRNSLSVSPKTLPNGLPSQPREASVKKEVSKLSEEDRPGGDSEVKSARTSVPSHQPSLAQTPSPHTPPIMKRGREDSISSTSAQSVGSMFSAKKRKTKETSVSRPSISSTPAHSVGSVPSSKKRKASDSPVGGSSITHSPTQNLGSAPPSKKRKTQDAPNGGPPSTNPPVQSVAPAPPPKRKTPKEVPIWARPALDVRLLAKYKKQQQTTAKPPINNVNNNVVANRAPAPPGPSQPNRTANGPLGYFEESIYGHAPTHHDLQHKVRDFLFQKVVYNNTLQTTTVTETPSVEGALEIEAKIGTIIDKTTHQRLRLPITTEAALAEDYDVGFESIMTLPQHATYNSFLNDLVAESNHTPKTPDAPARVKLQYAHTHEIDSFYALPAHEHAALAPQVRDILAKAGHAPRVRVTRDSKTGEVKAQVIKARIADLHIRSPATHFDYRISVNLEANYAGDVGALIRTTADGGGREGRRDPDRHKDRMSYTHGHNQIDLTQVKSSANASAGEASHELEVELDSTAVREEGLRVVAKEENRYWELVEAFLNNVRILVHKGGGCWAVRG